MNLLDSVVRSYKEPGEEMSVKSCLKGGVNDGTRWNVLKSDGRISKDQWEEFVKNYRNSSNESHNESNDFKSLPMKAQRIQRIGHPANRK